MDTLTGKRYRVAEALHRGLVDEGFAQQLRQCELVVTSWTIACQASLSMELPQQKYWSG